MNPRRYPCKRCGIDRMFFEREPWLLGMCINCWSLAQREQLLFKLEQAQ